jgi:phosphinothricin acetyltransferase
MEATARGKGIGAALLHSLITASETDGYWTLQAQIIAENHASRALHRKCGFREVGCRERYGHIDDVWRDVILLERRSDLAGGANLPTKTCG